MTGQPREATEVVIDAIRLERRRQMHVEGWTPEHDDLHADGEMAKSAAVYALASAGVVRLTYSAELAEVVPQDWPWAGAWWKPKDRRRNLIRAAALLVAEVERLDREAARNA